MSKQKKQTEPPANFGNDELSRQLKRNAESFAVWWAKNHPWDWWAKDRKGKPLPLRDRLLVCQLVRAAYDREDLFYKVSGDEQD